MNKYLLLRDNKQSGPYTVPEIIEKGIKPYDLVWLDGKSIAWRYPSEIEELKAFAPTVEEQPFDRFYKKPESVKQMAPAEPVFRRDDNQQQDKVQHSPYEPKISVEATDVELPAQKKVYINFPTTTTPVKKSAPEKAIVSTEVKPPVPQPQYEPVSFTEKSSYHQPAEKISTYSSKTKTNKNHIYIAAAACVVLIGFIAILLVNNNNQQERLKELNTIVKEIENKKVNDLTAQTTQVSNTSSTPEPTQPQTSETIVNPELLASNDYNQPKPAGSEAVNPPVEKNTTPEKSEKSTEIAPGIVYKERPVLRRSDNQQAQPAANSENTETESSSENIYKLVTVKPNSYKTGVLGGISNLQFELTNNSKRELHKVAIEIKYLGPEKKIVNKQTIYFENVSPGKNATIDVPKSKRGVSIDYTITDIKS